MSRPNKRQPSAEGNANYNTGQSANDNTTTGFDPSKVAAEIMAQQQQVMNSLKVLKELPAPEVGHTYSKVIATHNNMQLRYYPAASTAEAVAPSAPLLIVYALVNRPYILDLQPDRSLIKALTDRGQPVYLIDWGSPKPVDRYTDLEDYIGYFLDEFVTQTLSHAKQAKVNLLGICQGGTFSLCYSTLFPEKVNAVIPLVTPVNFHTTNSLSQLAQHIDVKTLADVYGNIPGYLLTEAFKSLMPMRLGLQKNAGLAKQLSSADKALNFFRMERWIHDSPDLCGQAFVEFMQWFYQENRLVTGKLSLLGRTVDLTTLSLPILNIFAQKDHLVPPESAQALKALATNADYQEHCLPGGHIGVFVGKQAQQQLPDLIIQWLHKKTG